MGNIAEVGRKIADSELGKKIAEASQFIENHGGHQISETMRQGMENFAKFMDPIWERMHGGSGTTPLPTPAKDKNQHDSNVPSR
jgi:hypothetical protein